MSLHRQLLEDLRMWLDHDWPIVASRVGGGVEDRRGEARSREIRGIDEGE